MRSHPYYQGAANALEYNYMRLTVRTWGNLNGQSLIGAYAGFDVAKSLGPILGS